MNHAGHLLTEALLERAAAGIGAVLGNEGVDLVVTQTGENLDVALCLLVTDVEPELVEPVRRGVAAVEPDIALLRLAELLAVGLGDERAGEGVGFGLSAEGAANELRAGGDVAPLVRAAHLQFAVLGLVEVEKVVPLEQLVGELCEREAVAGLAIEAFLDAVLGHHVVDGDVLADVAGEVEEGEVLHPVVVVDQFGRIGGVGAKVEEAGELRLDAADVMAQGVLSEQVALGALARGVANHACGAADEGQRLMPSALEVAEHHDRAKVTDVKRVGGGVDADVGRHLLLVQEFFGAGHHLVEHTAPP